MKTPTFNPYICTPGIKRGRERPDGTLPTNYAEALAALDKAHKRRGQARGMIAYCTDIRMQGDSVIVRLHSTDIVAFRPDGSSVISTGGWQTYLTRDRLNRMGFSVSMGGGVPTINTEMHGPLPFVDGMTMPGKPWPGRQPDYPAGLNPWTLDVAMIRRHRARALARERRELKRIDADLTLYADTRRAAINNVDAAWRWPKRSGGYSPHNGTVPEVWNES